MCSMFGIVCPSQYLKPWSVLWKCQLPCRLQFQDKQVYAASTLVGHSFLRDSFCARRASADVCGAVLLMKSVNQTQILCMCLCVFVFVWSGSVPRKAGEQEYLAVEVFITLKCALCYLETCSNASQFISHLYIRIWLWEIVPNSARQPGTEMGQASCPSALQVGSNVFVAWLHYVVSLIYLLVSA